MNNDFQGEKHTRNLKKVYYAVGVIVLLGMCFSLSYLITDRLTNPKYSDKAVDNSEEKIVYNSTDKLDDSVVIDIMVNDQLEKEQSLQEFKEENNISVDINEQFLIDYMKSSGYELEALNEGKIVFNKMNNEAALLPNKYYLGEKDGFFAIYKTDDNGEAYIESESDVFSDYKKVNTIPVSAEEEIKGLKHYYDTKEEALERLAGYMN